MPFDPDTGLISYDPTCRSMNSPRYHMYESGDSQRGIVISESSHGWYVLLIMTVFRIDP